METEHNFNDLQRWKWKTQLDWYCKEDNYNLEVAIKFANLLNLN